MGLREVGGGVWIDPRTMEKGDVGLEKGRFLGFAENENGTYCEFKNEAGEQINIGGRTLITACERIDLGDSVKVVYDGKVKFKNGRTGYMWKLFIYEEEEDETGTSDRVSTEAKSKKKQSSRKADAEEEVEEAEDEVAEEKPKTSRKAKTVRKKAAAKKKPEPVEEEGEDDMDELDNLD